MPPSASCVPLRSPPRLGLRRLRRTRSACSGRLRTHCYRQAQRRRSAGLASRRPRTNARLPLTKRIGDLLPWNALPPPDTPLQNRDGELIGSPSPLIDPALLSIEGQKIELYKHPFFTAVLDRDGAPSVRRTHIARSEIHKVAVLSDQHDVVRSVIFDDEVDRPQTLRDKSGALWLDPLHPVPVATLRCCRATRQHMLLFRPKLPVRRGRTRSFFHLHSPKSNRAIWAQLVIEDYKFDCLFGLWGLLRV